MWQPKHQPWLWSHHTTSSGYPQKAHIPIGHLVWNPQSCTLMHFISFCLLTPPLLGWRQGRQCLPMLKLLKSHLRVTTQTHIAANAIKSGNAGTTPNLSCKQSCKTAPVINLAFRKTVFKILPRLAWKRGSTHSGTLQPQHEGWSLEVAARRWMKLRMGQGMRKRSWRQGSSKRNDGR